MHRNLVRKVITAVAVYTIIIQSLTPLLVLMPQKSYAQTVNEDPVITPTPAPTDSPVPTPTDTLTPTPTETPAPTDSPIPTETPAPTETPIPSPTPVDNLSPPADLTPTPTDNQNSSNNPPASAQQVQGDSATVTPEPTSTPTPEPATGNEELSLVILKNTSAPAIDLSATVSQGSAVLKTDKADYAPTDTVLITGTNLNPNTDYILSISSEDQPPIGVNVQVKSDDKGEFAYAYQLDGTYRPNYKAELKDLSGTVVATTTFTDTQPSVTICHRSSSDSNPYQTESPNIQNDGSLTGGHLNHTGPIWPSRGADNKWGDIIPPYINGAFNYPGMNWTAQGQAILNSGCQKPEPDLIASKTDSAGGTITLGGSFTWVINVKNQGSATATFSNNDVIFVDNLPTTATYGAVSTMTYGTTGTITCAKISNDITCKATGTVTIPVDTYFLVSLVATPSLAGTITNPRIGGSNKCAVDPNNEVDESTGSNNSCENTVTVVSPKPDLTITKTNNVGGNATSGQAFTWTIHVANSGNVSADFSEGETILTDNLPSDDGNISYGSPTVSNLVNITHNGGVICSINSSENLTCSVSSGSGTRYVNIGSGGSFDVTFTVTIADPGTYINPRSGGSNKCKVDPSGKINESNEDNNSCSDQITVTQPTGTITVIKDVVPNDSGITGWDFAISGPTSNNVNNLHDGGQSSANISNAGIYTITETAHSGTSVSNYTTAYNCVTATAPITSGSGRVASFILGANQNIVCTFTNTLKSGSISGHKYNDKNGNGSKNSGENYLSGWTIRLCADQNCSSVLQTDITDNNGNYLFNDLVPGWYYVKEDLQTGWEQISPAASYYHIYVDPGENNTNKDFGNRQLGSIKVCKVVIDPQGHITNGSALPGITFTINWTGGDGLSSTVFTSGYTPNTQIFTDSQGNDAYCVDYPNIPLANYGYSQEVISESGWQTPKYNDQFNAQIMDLNDFYYYQAPGNENSNGYIDLANQAGPDRTLVILNQYQNGSITGYKWNDLNSDGSRCSERLTEGFLDGIENGGCEPKLPGWEIELKDMEGTVIATTITDENGDYIFDNVAPGEYQVCEVQKPGWEQTFPGDETCWQVEVKSDGHPFDLYFGNHNLIPKLTITKSNDASGNKAPGDIVKFTITISNATDAGQANNVKVIDLLPKGFKYNSGSWKAVLNDTTDLSISEPTYASPGTWNLPNMNTGDKITLTYSATVDSAQQTGTYYDSAWGQGTPVSDSSNIILAVADPIIGNIGDPNFVGTQVAIINGNQAGVDYKAISTREVLGASIGPELPATGESTLWVIIATLLMGIGVGSMFAGFKLKKRYE